MAANDAVSMNVAENRQNVPMAIQENRAAVPMVVAEGGGTPGGLNGKADKVTGAAAGNLAGLDSTGNLTDSGKAPGDFLEAPASAGTQGQVLTADGEGGASWQDPTGGDPTEIIDDEAGSGDTDKVWSADKSHELLTEITNKMDEPSAEGSNGQVLTTNGSGGRSWQNPPAPSDAQVATAVSSWIDAHPEAVTTVQDGAVTEPKLADTLKQKIMVFPLLNGWSTVNYESGYLNSSGGITSNGSFRHTDYIPVSEGDVISYKLMGYSTTVYIIVGYDSSKAKVTGADVVGSSSWKEGTYTVPSGVAFVRLCSDGPTSTTLYFRSETVHGMNPDAVKEYIDSADNALSARITANANELAQLDGLESVKDFYVKSPNLYNPDAATVGTTYTWTDYMPVEEGKRYTQWADGPVYQLYWYNSSKTEISHISADENAREAVAPANAVYARLYFAKAGVTKIMFAEGVVGDYVPYGVLIPKESLPDYIVRDTNNINNTHKFAKGMNISTSTGKAGASSGRSVTDFIPVEEGKTYYFGGEGDGSLNMTGGAAYDDSYAFVEGIDASSASYTASTGVAFIRLGYSTPASNNSYCHPCVREGQTGVSGIERFNKYDNFKIVTTLPTAYEQANSLYGLKWNAMGDSITEGSGTTKSYVTFIKERTGIIPTGYGVSNTAIARRNPSYTNDMSVRYVNMTDDADIVTVFGGTNDHGNSIPIGEWGDNTVDTLYGAMKILCEGLIGKYMGKKIGFILPLPKYESSTDYSYPNASFGAYIECIKDVCKRYSIPYLDLYTECGFAPKIEAVRTAMIPDGLHPNVVGHELISWQIQRFLERV